MDLNKLYYFHIVAKHQHVTHAAQELYISQPALTKAMKRLEQDLGVPLLYKQRRGIHLTPYGVHLKAQLENVFSVLDHIPGELEQLKQQTANTIKLNVLVSALITTDAIAAYKAKHPHVNFQVLQEREDTDCHISISTGIEDFRMPDAVRQHVITEGIYLAVPQSGRYAAMDDIDLRSVKDEWFISISHARPFRRISDSFCHEAGFNPKVTFESDFPSAVRNLISAGAGIGFWPAFSFGDRSGDMKLLPIRTPRCQRKVILRLHRSPTSAAAEAFYDYLVDYLKQKAKNV